MNNEKKLFRKSQSEYSQNMNGSKFVPVLRKRKKINKTIEKSILRRKIKGCFTKPITFAELSKINFPKSDSQTIIFPLTSNGYNFDEFFERDISEKIQEKEINEIFLGLKKIDKKYIRLYESFELKILMVSVIILAFSILLFFTILQKFDFLLLLAPIYLFILFSLLYFFLRNSLRKKINILSLKMEIEYKLYLERVNEKVKGKNVKFEIENRGCWISCNISRFEIDDESSSQNFSFSELFSFEISRETDTQIKNNSTIKQTTSSLVPPLCQPPPFMKTRIIVPDKFKKKTKSTEHTKKGKSDRIWESEDVFSIPNEFEADDQDREMKKMSMRKLKGII